MSKIPSTEINKNHSDLATVYTKRQDNMANFMRENEERIINVTDLTE